MFNSDFWLHKPKHFAEDRTVIFALLLLFAALYLPGLGGYGLYDPWETHYGEVARNMVEHSNYIDPFWGSPWDPTDVKRERAGFYSKPPMTMWMMAAGMNLFGFNALGVRAFFPIFALLALMAIYLAVSRFKNRRAGVLATLVCGTSPFFALVSHQAVTDAPMVAIMTAGMMALALGLFGVEDDEEIASPTLYWFTLGLLVLVMLSQLWVLLPMDRSPDVIRPYPGSGGFIYSIQWWFKEVFEVGRGKGWIIALTLLPVAGYAAWRVAKQKRRRLLYIYLFYIACGLVVPSKGWLAWAPMGMTILGYMAVTGEWRRFLEVDIPTGLLIVFMVGHPWCIAMLGGHHPGWYKRFWIHDHVNRLFAGVHDLDSGAFEYFFKWIGYGLFPWIGLLPVAIVRILGLRRDPEHEFTREQKFQIFVFLWAIFGFFLFSKSSTKFHHYIFPIIPPLAILIGLTIEDILQGGRRQRLLLLAAVAVTFWVGQDLYRLPGADGQGSQSVVNLFTYKYDREWPDYTPPDKLETLEGEPLEEAEFNNEFVSGFANVLGLICLGGATGILFMAFAGGWNRRYGALILSGSAIACAAWGLHVYLPKVSVHWSQEQMWDTYYDQCSKFDPGDEAEYQRFMLATASRIPSRPDMFPRARCREPIVAFRTNWRGEAFYSANTVLPAIEIKHLKPFLESWGNTKPFYLFTERSRVKSELDPNLPKPLKKAYKEVFGSNLKFVLLRFDPPPAKTGS